MHVIPGTGFHFVVVQIGEICEPVCLFPLVDHINTNSFMKNNCLTSFILQWTGWCVTWLP